MYKVFNNRGFSEVRTLIALLITMTILPICVSVFRFASNIEFDYDKVNSELAFADLRRILLISYDMEVSEYELNFIYHNDNYKLSCVNDKLILQPGTQIIVDNIIDASFMVYGDSIYVSYTDEKGNEYERNIGSSKRFCIADFSNDNDELSDDPFDGH